MTDEELNAKLRDLTAKATTGLGTWSVCTGDLIAVDYNDETPWFIARGPSCESGRLALAAEAVNALPHLLDRIETLTAEAERLREALRVLRDLPIVENDNANTLHLDGVAHTGPVVDWLFHFVRKIKKVSDAALEKQP
jgi:hypothetical protein